MDPHYWRDDQLELGREEEEEIFSSQGKSSDNDEDLNHEVLSLLLLKFERIFTKEGKKVITIAKKKSRPNKSKKKKAMCVFGMNSTQVNLKMTDKYWKWGKEWHFHYIVIDNLAYTGLPIAFNELRSFYMQMLSYKINEPLKNNKELIYLKRNPTIPTNGY